MRVFGGHHQHRRLRHTERGDRAADRADGDGRAAPLQGSGRRIQPARHRPHLTRGHPFSRGGTWRRWARHRALNRAQSIQPGTPDTGISRVRYLIPTCLLARSTLRTDRTSVLCALKHLTRPLKSSTTDQGGFLQGSHPARRVRVVSWKVGIPMMMGTATCFAPPSAVPSAQRPREIGETPRRPPDEEVLAAEHGRLPVPPLVLVLKRVPFRR